MWSFRWSGAAFCVWAVSVTLALGSCGEDSGGDDDSSMGGSGGSTQGLPAGTRIVANVTPPLAGECRSTADCDGGRPGAACATMAGSYRVCTFQTPEATAATTPGNCGPGQACAAGSTCYPVLTFPSGQCGSGGARDINTCLSDGCASDADCPGGVCGPRGLSNDEDRVGGAIRQCFPAVCTTSAECTKQMNGICALVQATCAPAAGGAQMFLPAQLACVYPGGCTGNSNCPDNAVCRVVSGEGVCVAPQ